MNTTTFTPADAAELYGIPNWSSGYFRVTETGKVEVTPGPGLSAVLPDIVEELVARGESLPVILRFPQVIEGRVRQLNEAFRNAIAEYG